MIAAGEKHYCWKGEKAGYVSKHDWMRKYYGKAYICEAENCTKRSNFYEWANLSGDYKRERSDWKMMCRSCHRLMDLRKPYCKNDHLYTEENSRFSKGKRYCRNCDREYYQNVTKPKEQAIKEKFNAK